MKNIIEISDNLKVIKGENEGRYPHSNSLLVEDEKVALIDTGAGGEKMKGLAEEIDIDIIINSHCHEDHIPHNNLFDSPIYIHESETHVLKNLDELANIYTPKGAEKWDEVSGFLHDFVGYEGLEDVFEFGDGHVFDLGGTKLKVVHTPGHSRGHCAFLDPDERILFSGDIDFASFGPWYGGMDSDVDDFIRSIQKLRKLEPVTIVPGHEEIISEDVDLEFESYLEKIYEREVRILDFLSEERTVEEMVGQGLIYKRLPEYLQWWYEMMERTMLDLHLDRLTRKGKIERTNSGYRRD